MSLFVRDLYTFLEKLLERNQQLINKIIKKEKYI